eukprot:UN06682
MNSSLLHQYQSKEQPQEHKTSSETITQYMIAEICLLHITFDKSRK